MTDEDNKIVRLKDYAGYHAKLPESLWPPLPADIIDFVKAREATKTTVDLSLDGAITGMGLALLGKMLLSEKEKQTRVERAIDAGLDAFIGKIIGETLFEKIGRDKKGKKR